MERIQKAQIAKMVVVFMFLILIPFVSTSMRPSYLYFLLNVLIVLLALDSGILQSNKLREEKMNSSTAGFNFVSPPPPSTMVAPRPANNSTTNSSSLPLPSVNKVIMKKMPEIKKSINVSVAQKRLKRCPTVQSLFFIGGCEDKDDVVNYNSTDEEEDDVWDDDNSELDQELFARAENFIGNFYRQLKIQREESWKKIHGLYHNKL